MFRMFKSKTLVRSSLTLHSRQVYDAAHSSSVAVGSGFPQADANGHHCVWGVINHETGSRHLHCFQAVLRLVHRKAQNGS